MKPFLWISFPIAAFSTGCNPAAQTSPVSSVSASQADAPDKKLAAASNTGLRVPRGFTVSLLADGLQNPRRLAQAPGGTAQKYDVFVAESQANRVSVLRVQNGQVASKIAFSQALSQPYGLAFGSGRLYVGNTDSVVAFPFQTGQTQAKGAPERVATLTRGGYNQHWTRNLLFDSSAKKLFVTVGSSCNTCEEDDPQRAAISVMNPDGSGKKVFASGLRNPVGLALQPGTKQLWTVVNERDNLGDDVPPDYLTSVKADAFYGWPYAYTDMGRKTSPDPNFGDKNPTLVAKTVAPDVPVQAHSAALGVAFYPLRGGNFPKEFAGDAFLAFHGSWNRSARTGYKIVRVDFQGDKPGAVSDFVTGFLNDSQAVTGRPVDVQIAPDGSLLFSDDQGGKIWRVTADKK